jgi:16S rRNA (cytosine967-C5)-methyltransferase
MNSQAPVFLRVNLLKTDKHTLKEALLKAGIETSEVPECTNALKLTKRENVFQNKLFKDGMFEVQDAGSQLISEFLDPKPGDTVIDACAGAGGKSLHLAALMKNKGRIISLDVEDWKLEELKKRARRAGAFNVEARLIEKSNTIKNLKSKADKILLDVPCSGLGVIRRNPDAKWKLSLKSIEETKKMQEEILNSYSGMLKINGTLVYSTCSILPSENHEQVNKFLETNKNFTMLEENTLFPHRGFDGFYMAMLKREA